jgi:membrane protease YdiL (CAAX protease family)
MNIMSSKIHLPDERRNHWRALWIIVALIAFCAVFVLIDQVYYRFISTRFPDAGASAGVATLYGIVSRAHVIVPLLLLVMWRPRLLGFQVGQMRQYWRMLLVMLIANCGVVGVYLWLTNSATPYSGNQWLVTEVVTVPLVEETMWRGVVFAVLLLAFQRIYLAGLSSHLAVWSCGLAFGLLHAGNALAGAPLPFVAIQVLNAAVWGVVYGYARAKTESVYPPIVLHAAMNLVVVLF